MKIHKRFHSLLSVSFLLGCLLCLDSCQTVKGLQNKALEMVGLKKETQKKEQKVEAEVVKDESAQAAPQLNLPPIDLPTTEAALTDSANQENATENAKATTETTPTTQVAEAPQEKQSATPLPRQIFKIAAPIAARVHLGGAPHFVAVDESYVYLDFLSELTITSRSFTVIAKRKIPAPLKEIKKLTHDQKTFFFLKEENNILEILELVPGSTELNTVLSKEMEAPFTWLNDHLIAVQFPDKLQILNIDKPNDVTIDSELALLNVTDILPYDKFLYLARDQYLDILNFETLETQSTLRIGRQFTLEGLMKQEGQLMLVLAYRTQDDSVQAIQNMKLSADGSSIADFADHIVLPTPLHDIQIDLVNGLMVGSTINTQGKATVHLFSLIHQKMLRGPLERITDPSGWFLNQSQLTVIDGTAVTCSKIDLAEKVITQASSIQQMIDDKSNVPLAQVGAAKIVRDEYDLIPVIAQRFANEPRQLSLLDREHLAWVETDENQKQILLTTTNLGASELKTTTPLGAEDLEISQWLSTSLGIFIYSETTRQISYLDPDLAKIQKLPLQIDSLLTWTFFSSTRGDTLVLVTTKKPTAKQPARYQISFYQLNSPQDMPLVYSMPSTDPAFVFYIPRDQILVFTPTKMLLYDWNKFWPEETLLADVAPKAPQDVAPDETVDFKDVPLDILAAKLSPSFDRLYTLINTPTGMNILVFNILDMTQKHQLKDITVTPLQFLSSAFAIGGRLFILPTNHGTIFYDMTSPVQEREITRWPEPSAAVDVTDGGKFTCAATKTQGIYCGDLLF